MKNEFHTIDDALCAYLDKKSRRTTLKRGHEYWSASSLGRCERHQVMARAGIITNGYVNYSWKNAAEDGHMAHAWRQFALHDIGIMVDMEGKITDKKLNYRGHYDALVYLGDRLVLVDIKTQNSRAYKRRSRLPGKIDPGHQRQLASYYYFLKKSRPELAAARLYYVNKNTGEREELELRFDDDLFTDIINELKRLNWHWDNNLLPKKNVDSFCKLCQFAPICRSLMNRKTTTIKDAVQRSLQDAT